jgi:hypothetical protein
MNYLQRRRLRPSTSVTTSEYPGWAISDSRWRLTRGLWWVVAVCAIGAAVQGWDQTGSNGASESYLLLWAETQISDSQKSSVSIAVLTSLVELGISGYWGLLTPYRTCRPQSCESCDRRSAERPEGHGRLTRSINTLVAAEQSLYLPSVRLASLVMCIDSETKCLS